MNTLKKKLPLYILGAMILGALFGSLFPKLGVDIQPLGAAFLRLIKMSIIPLIVTTLIVSITGVGDIKRVGRMGLKTILWFELITTLILFLGLAIANIIKPGEGINLKHLPKADISAISETIATHDIKTFLLNIIPTNIIDSLAKGDLLAIIFFCIMFSLALTSLGKKEITPFFQAVDVLSKASFKLVGMIMIFSPIGVFALTATTVGTYGISVLLPLLKLVGTAYLGLAIIVFGLFPIISLLLKVKITEIYKMIWDLMLIGASATTMEPILAELMKRLEKFGVPKSISSFVIPVGMPLNADGTALYLTIAAPFIAQAFGIDMSFSQQLIMVLVFMVTSKGMAAVPSSSMVILLATSIAVGLPTEGVALIFGIDRVIDMARTAVNIMGHTIASIVIAKSEGVFKKETENIYVKSDHFSKNNIG